MVDGKRPERVLMKSDHQTVSCPGCGKAFDVPAKQYNAVCPHCQAKVNWGLGR